MSAGAAWAGVSRGARDAAGGDGARTSRRRGSTRHDEEGGERWEPRMALRARRHWVSRAERLGADCDRLQGAALDGCLLPSRWPLARSQAQAGRPIQRGRQAGRQADRQTGLGQEDGPSRPQFQHPALCRRGPGGRRVSRPKPRSGPGPRRPPPGPLKRWRAPPDGRAPTRAALVLGTHGARTPLGPSQQSAQHLGATRRRPPHPPRTRPTPQQQGKHNNAGSLPCA